MNSHYTILRARVFINERVDTGSRLYSTLQSINQSIIDFMVHFVWKSFKRPTLENTQIESTYREEA